MEYLKATTRDADAICELVQETIRTIYPRYYPQEVTDFFCRLHSRDNIGADIEKGRVGVLTDGSRLLGTGSSEGDHITRVYVAPDFQGNGYGSRIMQRLEDGLAAHYSTAYLDASLPAARLYEKRGYWTVRHEIHEVDNHAVLAYEVMEKELCGAAAAFCYDGKFFVPERNSENGEVDGETVFSYRQKGPILWADYAGGGVTKGHLLGTAAESGELDFYYHHINGEGQVRIGTCHSIPRVLEDGRIELAETWQWLNGDRSEGASVVVER